MVPQHLAWGVGAISERRQPFWAKFREKKTKKLQKIKILLNYHSTAPLRSNFFRENRSTDVFMDRSAPKKIRRILNPTLGMWALISCSWLDTFPGQPYL